MTVLLTTRLLFASTAWASQGTQPALLLQPVAGDCVIRIPSNAATTWDGGLRVSGQNATVAAQRLSTGEIALRLKVPLERGEAVEVGVGNGAWSTPVDVVAGDPLAMPTGPCYSKGAGDTRPVMTAEGRVGWIIDTFAVNLRDLQENAAVKAKTASETEPTAEPTWDSRVVADFLLSYRLLQKGPVPIWLTANAWYGLRPGLDCHGETVPGVCRGDDPQPGDALDIVRRARTAELYLGARIESPVINAHSGFPARFFLSIVRGGVFIADVSPKLMVNHSLGGGIIWTDGRFRDSYLQLAWGKNETFAPDNAPWNRKKFDALLVFSLAPSLADNVKTLMRTGASLEPFLRVSVDAARGVDSFQTTFGVNVDIAQMFGAYLGQD